MASFSRYEVQGAEEDRWTDHGEFSIVSYYSWLVLNVIYVVPLQTGEGNPWLRTRDMSSRHFGRRDGLVLATKSVRSPLEQP